MGKFFDIIESCAKIFLGAMLGVVIIAFLPAVFCFSITFIFFCALFYPFTFIWKKYVAKHSYPNNMLFRKLKEFSEKVKDFFKKILAFIDKCLI